MMFLTLHDTALSNNNDSLEKYKKSNMAKEMLAHEFHSFSTTEKGCISMSNKYISVEI